MPLNLIEKITRNFVAEEELTPDIKSGDFVNIEPAYVMTHDNTGAVIPKFMELGSTRLYNPSQVVFTLDHDIQNLSSNNIAKYRKIEEFASRMGNDFYPAGKGIGHQIMIDEGYVIPGTFVVASDSHSNIYGGLGALGTPVVRTDAASIWATGKTWWQIPPVLKVNLNGKLNKNVSGKDIIITLCGYFKNDEVLNCAIEFGGEGIKTLSISQRLTIANMTTEWGAVTGVFPFDEVTYSWFEEKVKTNANSRLNPVLLDKLKKFNLAADKNAFYHKTLEIDLSGISPVVSGPNSVKKYTPVNKLEKENIKIDKAFLLSCTNARYEDLAEAAEILKNKKIHNEVKFYVAAASEKIQLLAEETGIWNIFSDAGAVFLPPGCGPCIGLGEGILSDNETAISATNRNFKGRMGSASANVYLASPVVVAVSAVNGFISGPDETFNVFSAEIKTNTTELNVSGNIILEEGFKDRIVGKALFVNRDNINTDAIYPGKYTYNDSMTPQEQAAVCMENYNSDFSALKEGKNILITGYNFGSGSSREQAATSIKYSGFEILLCGSINSTFLRNAINNGLLCLSVPSFLEYIRTKFSTDDDLIEIPEDIIIDFVSNKIFSDSREFLFNGITGTIQKIILSGKLENYLINTLNRTDTV